MSVAAAQLKEIWLNAVTVAVMLVGAVGGVMSAAAGVVSVRLPDPAEVFRAASWA